MKLTAIVCAVFFISKHMAFPTQSNSVEKNETLLAVKNTDMMLHMESRIFGGSEANASSYPYVVSLRLDKADGKTYCGGTLVAPQYIVTAAHCVKMNDSTIFASIGSAFGSGAKDGQQIKVIKGYRHPLYKKFEHLYDVGLLKLEKEVSTGTIGLCAADGSDNEVGSVATVRGWGLTEKGSQSYTMAEVNVTIISNAECNRVYDNRITTGMLCAGEGDGKDTCNGDSGGPLIVNNVLVGIVSWGGQCGVSAGVYTRVSYVLDYINTIIGNGTGSNVSKNFTRLHFVDNTSISTQVTGTTLPTTQITTGDSSKSRVTKTPTFTPSNEILVAKAPTAAPSTVSLRTEAPTAPSTVSLRTEAPTAPSTVSLRTEAPTAASLTLSPVADAPIATLSCDIPIPSPLTTLPATRL